MQSKVISTVMPLLRLVLPPTFKATTKMLRELEAFLLCHGFKKTDRWLTPDMASVVVEFLQMRERRKERELIKGLQARLERKEYDDDDDILSSDDEEYSL